MEFLLPPQMKYIELSYKFARSIAQFKDPAFAILKSS